MLGSVLGLWANQPLGADPPSSAGVGSSCGMDPRLDKSLVGHSHNLCVTLITALLIGRTDCRLYGWVGVPIPSMEGLSAHRRWPDQATYPNLLGVLAGVTLADSWDFPNLGFLKHCIFGVQNSSAHGGCRLMSNHLFKISICNGYHCQFDGT